MRMPRTTAGDDGSGDGDARPVVIVGAGMAGLTCAAALHAAGRTVVVLEASDGVGGRVRTDRHPDGYLLDRSYQVILDGYPALRRWVSLPTVRPKAFDAGALVWTGMRLVPLADPRRHPGSILRNLTNTVITPADKIRLVAFGARARMAHWESAQEAAEAAGPDSSLDVLRAAGFSEKLIDRFARPFWGGITLDPGLHGSAGPLLFTLKMFLQGSAVLPEEGVGQVPIRLSQKLPHGAVRLRTPVEEIVLDDGRADGVRVGGELIRAAAVVVAADPPAARALTGIDAIPTEGLGSLTTYLVGSRDPGIGAKIVLDGTGKLDLNEIAPLSTVQPSYAPAGKHLIAAAAVGEPLERYGDDELAGRLHADTIKVLGHRPDDWEILTTVRVPFAQFAQPPGIHEHLPRNRTATPGLFLASEATVDSSINGAVISGERAAGIVDVYLRGDSAEALRGTKLTL